MKINNKKQLIHLIISAFVLMFMISCEDNWDKHYHSSDNNSGINGTIYDYISSDSDLSSFTQMLKTTGYDTILSASQSYTVWAPINEHLSNYDAANHGEALSIVENHIARGSINGPYVGAKYFKVLNGKRNFISSDGASSVYVLATIAEKDIRTNNGLVNKLSGAVPYIPNLWEYVNQGEELDSLAKYLNSLVENVFDPEISTEIGINEDGNPVYDSIYVSTNRYFERYGDLSNENLLQTFLYLKNSAWIEAYDKLSSCFVFPDIHGGAERQDATTKQFITNNLLYRYLEDITSLDSVVSRGRQTFYDPQYLFAGTEMFLSNGKGFVLDHFPFVDTLTWLEPIKVEAESATRRVTANNEVITQSPRPGEYDISRNYILLRPTGTADFTKSTAEFSIPNVKSAKYNLYVVFVPPVVERADNTLKNKVSFRLSYINNKNGNTTRKNLRSDDYVTSGTEITKMFVDQIEFPFANIVDEDYEDIRTTLLITNEVRIAEEVEGDYTREMRIDYIILEPVVE